MGREKMSKENHRTHPRLRAGATRQHRGACPCAVPLLWNIGGIAVMRPKEKLIRYCASRGPVRPGG
nr:MAG TPA: hypothetical protein [Caudoviricetes sp.]